MGRGEEAFREFRNLLCQGGQSSLAKPAVDSVIIAGIETVFASCFCKEPVQRQQKQSQRNKGRGEGSVQS
jgi:hypothetical protein